MKKIFVIITAVLFLSAVCITVIAVSSKDPQKVECSNDAAKGCCKADKKDAAGCCKADKKDAARGCCKDAKKADAKGCAAQKACDKK